MSFYSKITYLLTFYNIGAIEIVSLILVLEIQPLSSVLEQFWPSFSKGMSFIKELFNEVWAKPAVVA